MLAGTAYEEAAPKNGDEKKKDVAKPAVKQEVNCFSSFLELPHKQKNDKSAVPLLFLQLPCPAV